MTKLAPIEAELATIPEVHSDINHLFDLLQLLFTDCLSFVPKARDRPVGVLAH